MFEEEKATATKELKSPTPLQRSLNTLEEMSPRIHSELEYLVKTFSPVLNLEGLALANDEGVPEEEIGNSDVVNRIGGVVRSLNKIQEFIVSIRKSSEA